MEHGYHIVIRLAMGRLKLSNKISEASNEKSDMLGDTGRKYYPPVYCTLLYMLTKEFLCELMYIEAFGDILTYWV